MNIIKLTKIEGNPASHFGFNGYSTEKIYQVSQTHTADAILFQLTKVDHPYTKKWITTDEDIRSYNQLIQQGHSFGAVEAGEIKGWIICEYREWNNSLFIENILVSEKHRRKGTGQKLIESVITQAGKLQCRLVELETQNTNLPAIEFYQKNNFEITGINQKLYTGTDRNEIALFMTRDIMPIGFRLHDLG